LTLIFDAFASDLRLSLHEFHSNPYTQMRSAMQGMIERLVS